MRKEPLFLLFYKGPHKNASAPPPSTRHCRCCRPTELRFCHIVPAAGPSVLSGEIFFCRTQARLWPTSGFLFLPPTECSGAKRLLRAAKSLGSRSSRGFYDCGADGTVLCISGAKGGAGGIPRSILVRYQFASPHRSLERLSTSPLLSPSMSTTPSATFSLQ